MSARAVCVYVASRAVETLDTTDTGGDEGVFSSKNVTVAAYVAAPLLAFALLACFCARRRSRGPDSARTAARNSWAKGGAPAGPGGMGGHGSAAVGGARSLDNGGAAGSTKIFPASGSLSPKPSRKNSRGMTNGLDLEEMTLAGGLAARGGAAGAGAGASRGKGKDGGKAKAKKFSQYGADAAFAMTSSEDVGGGGAAGAGAEPVLGGAAYGARGGGGGDGSDSSGGAGTGRSSSPAGYDEDDVMGESDRYLEDDAAASAFDGGSMGRRVEEDDELSENGWGAYRSRDDSRSGLPSYEETQRREQRQTEPSGNGLVARAYSNRERNSERTLALAAGRAGRHAVPRRMDMVGVGGGESSRSVSLR